MYMYEDKMNRRFEFLTREELRLTLNAICCVDADVVGDWNSTTDHNKKIQRELINEIDEEFRLRAEKE